MPRKRQPIAAKPAADGERRRAVKVRASLHKALGQRALDTDTPMQVVADDAIAYGLAAMRTKDAKALAEVTK